MKYFKIEGIIQIDDFTLEQLTDIILDRIEVAEGSFAGDIKEVNSEGNDL